MARTQVTGFNILDDSVTGDDVSEEFLLLEKIPFSDPAFTSIQAKAAIIEAKASGGSSCPPWKNPTNTEYTISENTQLINVDGFEIEGQLNIDGSLVI